MVCLLDVASYAEGPFDFGWRYAQGEMAVDLQDIRKIPRNRRREVAKRVARKSL